MSDIFISYASEDRPRVKTLADALEAQGWSVWWDPDIPAGGTAPARSRKFDLGVNTMFLGQPMLESLP